MGAPNPYMLYIKLGALALVIIVIGLQYRMIKAKDKKIDEQKVALVLYADANASNQLAIAGLKDANEKWAKRGVDVAKSERALGNLVAERDALQIELNNRNTTRETIYVRDPNARKWAVTGVPADIADSLFPKTNR